MPLKAIPFIVCRCFALFAIYSAFVMLAGEYGHTAIDYIMADVDKSMSHRYADAIVLANVVFASLFWFGADWLAQKVTGIYSNQIVGLNIQIKDIQVTAFAVVGLAVACKALDHLGRLFGMIFAYSSLPAGAQTVYEKQMLSTFLTGVYWLVWGSIIFLAAPWFSRMLEKYSKKNV